MTYLFNGTPSSELLRRFSSGLDQVLTAKGHQGVSIDVDHLKLVFNFFTPERPRPFRRKGQATFVVGVVESDEQPDNILKAAYPLLVRSLSNLVIYLVRSEDDPSVPAETWFITPEQGNYSIPVTDGLSDAYFEAVYERLAPVASARLVIDNIFEPDLEESLWEGDAITQGLSEAGKSLDALNLLPAPFPIDRLLPPREMAHLKRLYSMGGLSYGNLSARKDGTRFWMSASGVDKANLKTIGQDILMVKGYDSERNAMLLSVPPNIDPRRVSVDAIEHWMIYTENPDVGAIVHVHAWMDGIPQTEINYPCGTYELGMAVAEQVRKAPDPSRAVVGLKNHGLTITGRSLEDIFERIEGRILPQVPMTS